MTTMPELSSYTTSHCFSNASSRHALVDLQMRPCALNCLYGITSIGVDSSKSAASDAWAAPLSIFASRFHRMANSRNSTPPPPPLTSSTMPLPPPLGLPGSPIPLDAPMPNAPEVAVTASPVEEILSEEEQNNLLNELS